MQTFSTLSELLREAEELGQIQFQGQGCTSSRASIGSLRDSERDLVRQRLPFVMGQFRGTQRRGGVSRASHSGHSQAGTVAGTVGHLLI